MNKIFSKKNILFVIKSIERGGGAERVLITITNELHKFEDLNITIMTFRTYENEYPTYLSRVNLKEGKVSSNFLLNFWKSLLRAKKIKNYCKENHIDTVVCFMKESNIPGVLSKIFFNNQARIFLTVHNDPGKEFSTMHRILARVLYKHADKIITVSKEAALFFTKNVMTIYNPISIRNNESEANEEITDNFENELFIKNDIIISIGRLSHQKNQSLMLDVFAQVEKRNPRLRLVILGGGDLRGALEEKIKKLKLTEKVFLLGVKQNVYKYLKKSKFFLFTSSFEGLGMVLLEAMSLGIPVVTNDCSSGPAEIVGGSVSHLPYDASFLKDKYGIRVPFNNTDEFVQAIEWFENDLESYKKYSDLSKDRARDFDISKIIKEWYQILR